MNDPVKRVEASDGISPDHLAATENALEHLDEGSAREAPDAAQVEDAFVAARATLKPTDGAMPYVEHPAIGEYKRRFGLS